MRGEIEVGGSSWSKTVVVRYFQMAAWVFHIVEMSVGPVLGTSVEVEGLKVLSDRALIDKSPYRSSASRHLLYARSNQEYLLSLSTASPISHNLAHSLKVIKNSH